jgi:hypothetical protein
VGNNTGGSYLGAESGNILIGTLCQGIAGDNRTTRIADEQSSVLGFAATRVFIGGIVPIAAIGSTDPVRVEPSTGQLFRFTSSARYKKDIKPMDKASESIFALKPVTFLAKDDAKRIPQFGLIAEEVAKVNPNLVMRDAEGRPDSVAYEHINAMVLNEFLKEHKKVEAQQATISELKNELQTVVAQLKEQAAQIQKVSAQIEVNKPAAKVVVNKP